MARQANHDNGSDVDECGERVRARAYVHVPWYTVSVFTKLSKNLLQAQKQHTDLENNRTLKLHLQMYILE